MAKVYLYEDNGGGLSLYREGDDIVWEGLQSVDSTFADDAAALAEGDTDQWSLYTCEWSVMQSFYENHDNKPGYPTLVAVYDATEITVVGHPGGAASCYLALSEDYAWPGYEYILSDADIV